MSLTLEDLAILLLVVAGCWLVWGRPPEYTAAECYQVCGGNVAGWTAEQCTCKGKE